MFNRILIANRGEIAVRIIRTARRLGIETVAVYSDADAGAMHVRQADQAIHIGPSTIADSYLNGEKIIHAAIESDAQAIHPGYGFLSENAGFVDAVTAAGKVFIGPSASAIRAMGLKDAAKTLMQSVGVPVVPGYHGSNQDPGNLLRQAEQIGFPVMIKARAGGGGKGMRLVESPQHFIEALKSAVREASSAFGDPSVLIEKYIRQPRHIEVQLFGDNHGNLVHLFERDCSVQRRHQKVVEEAPAPGMSQAVRNAMTDAAITAARAIDYSGAGTVEFIVDGSGPLRTDGFWFMEMNTRLQVEHPVTEAITGVDLVEAQLRVASGGVLPFEQQSLTIDGHSIEVRVYAEDVAAGFLPATGQVHHASFDSRARIDTGVCSGDTITPFYDPMVAKVITHESTRVASLISMRRALASTHIAGTVTNIEFLKALLQLDDFAQGTVDTGIIERNLTRLCTAAEPDYLCVLIAAYVLSDSDLHDSFSGWRLFGQASQLIRLMCQGKEYRSRMIYAGQGVVQLQPEHEATVLSEIRVVESTDASLSYVINGVRNTAHAVHWQDTGGRKVSVLASDHCHVFEQSDALAGSAQDVADVDSLVAPMTGIVRMLDAFVGQRVSEGERLLVMEAMKMETSLTAPRSGIIESINCTVGDNVEGGAILLRLQDPHDVPVGDTG